MELNSKLSALRREKRPFTRPLMAEEQGRKRKMAERREVNSGKKTTAAIQWPTIKPKQNLSVARLKDFDLFTVQNFFTSSESREFIKAAELSGFVHQGSLGPAKGEAYRNNDRISLTDSVLAETIWKSGLDKILSDIKIRGKVAVGLNPNIRFYRYKVGQRFGRHIDESVDFETGKRSHYTLLVYLSGASKPKFKNDASDFKDSTMEALGGGETVFYDSRNKIVAESELKTFHQSEPLREAVVNMEVAPSEGMALLHIHGAKCMLHEARDVTKGIKYVLRSDVVFA